MKIQKGDNVIVLSGKDRGKTGTILRAFPKKEQVLVEGVNVVKRHQRARRQGRAGQIIERSMPIDVSNVAIHDTDKKPSRVGYLFKEGKKIRIAKKSGTEL